MNKYFILSTTVMLSISHTMIFCHPDIHKKLPKMNNMFTPQEWTGVKVMGGLAGSAAITYASNRIVGEGKGNRFYNGKYAYGFSQSLKLSGVCFSLAPMLNEQWGDQFFRFGTRAPIVAGTAIVVAHPSTQQFALNIPFIGEHISTYKKESEGEKMVSKCGNQCSGICDRCFIPKMLLVVGLYKVIDPLVDQAGTWVGKKFGFIQEEEI
jgi:hypothetical protein